MSRKGESKSVHSLRAPKTWHISRKKNSFTSSSRAGPHKKEDSIPLVIIMRDMLNLGDTRKEIKMILNQGSLKINGKIVKDTKRVVGLFDSLSLDVSKEYYRVVLDGKGRYKAVEIPKKEANLRIVKVENKRALSKDEVQLNLSDGSNIIVKDKDYKTKDSLLIEVPGNKIIKVLKHKKGNLVLITKGKHAGRLAKIEDIKDDGKLVLKEKDITIETPEDYVLVVGEKSPELVIAYE